MKNLLVYYGWMNSFNSAQNSWTPELVAQDMAKYDMVVLGDGVQDTGHGDYANTSVIIPRIKALNPECLIFGYVTANQTYANFIAKAEGWDDLEIDGIFFDEAGYDYGSVATNGRVAINAKIDYVHSLSDASLCFMNAWKIEHMIGENEDASYPDTTWNSDVLDSNLSVFDWYLLESFAITSAPAFEAKGLWASRGESIQDCGLNIAALSVISDSDEDGQDKFDFVYTSAAMWNLDAAGTSDVNYGAGSAKTKMWARDRAIVAGLPYSALPAIEVHGSDADVYMRYLEGRKLEIDFSSGSETCSNTEY